MKVVPDNLAVEQEMQRNITRIKNKYEGQIHSCDAEAAKKLKRQMLREVNREKLNGMLKLSFSLDTILR